MSASVKKWYMFCKPRKINPVYPSLAQVIDFFAEPHPVDSSWTCARTTLNWILHSEIAKQMCMSREVAKMCTSRVYNLPKQPHLTDSLCVGPHYDH